MACPSNSTFVIRDMPTDGTWRYITHVNGQQLEVPIALAPGENIETAARQYAGSTTFTVQAEWWEP